MSKGPFRVQAPDGGGARSTVVEVASRAGSRLRVPNPPHRPDDRPSFPRFTQRPGDLPCPIPTANPEELSSHATGLVRVLDDDGRATGPWNPQLTDATLRQGLATMVQVRAFDARMMTMQRQGRLSFYLECTGEEAVAVAAGMALRPDDLLFPAYRQQGLFLVRGMPMLEMMCHCIGNQRDGSRGRQMPIHYSWKKGNLVSISSPVGTQYPQAVGAAMANAHRNEDHIVAAWVGDGTTSQGDFHHALNFASVYQPPVILNVVNNQWAISTHLSFATGGAGFATRAEAYGIPGIRVDGNDFLAVHAVTAWATERARRGAGPTLIELLTYRVAAHSSSDDPSRYRPESEAECWPGGDPIERLAGHLIGVGKWSDEQQHALESSARETVITTFKQAERIGSFAAGPFPPVESLVEDVYAQVPEHLQRQRAQMTEAPESVPSKETKAA
jgi:2-oxoisovalerate dehydrogenase E1 component alpha subunit